MILLRVRSTFGSFWVGVSVMTEYPLYGSLAAPCQTPILAMVFIRPHFVVGNHSFWLPSGGAVDSGPVSPFPLIPAKPSCRLLGECVGALMPPPLAAGLATSSSTEKAYPSRFSIL